MSSQPSTPSSLSSITEEISTRTILDMVKDFNTKEFIDYLGRKNLKLDKDDIKILHKEKISGLAFLELMKEKFHSIGLALGPATIFEEISDDDKAFEHYIKDIILKLLNVEIMTDANDKDISGEDTTGQVDYAIKGLEDLLCITEGKPCNIKIGYAQTNKKKRTLDQAFGNDYFNYIYGIVITGTEWHFIIYTLDGIFSTNGSEYQINLTKSAVKDNPELLRSNVKRVIGIIVGLLKDRVSVDSSSTSKRARIKKFIKK
ncbi:hypothetical protein RhiirA5_430427 [Rhizophagus irregularis]|uniref:Crinkler family protein n=1 Tax=Rhizophagus irregularis TaxID=588596 RepID=A0A2I1FD43_9GLOM|nr:hypothetical protein RhiirA5_430427 [Rhizophagus irregularis]PKC56416.1 hypothetical protein RhiirA1_474027 [Rhizophagus irregularis]PKY32310.1 hypothetical protein RhiirB3_450407 [Rhizophagus irregularis]